MSRGAAAPAQSSARPPPGLRRRVGSTLCKVLGRFCVSIEAGIGRDPTQASQHCPWRTVRYPWRIHRRRDLPELCAPCGSNDAAT